MSEPTPKDRYVTRQTLYVVEWYVDESRDGLEVHGWCTWHLNATTDLSLATTIASHQASKGWPTRIMEYRRAERVGEVMTFEIKAALLEIDVGRTKVIRGAGVTRWAKDAFELWGSDTRYGLERSAELLAELDP